MWIAARPLGGGEHHFYQDRELGDHFQLCHETVGSGGHAFRTHLGIIHSACQYDAHIGVLLSHDRGSFDSAHARHAHIHEYDLWL